MTDNSQIAAAGSGPLGRLMSPQMIVVALILLVSLCGALLSESFATSNNIGNLFGQSAFLAIIALGQTLPILTRGIDLSVGSTVAISAVLTSGLIDGNAERTWPVVAGVLALGVLIGCANAVIAHATRVHPLIVTLGMASILRGAMLLYSNTAPGGTHEEFGTFAMGRILMGEEGLTIDIWAASGLSFAGVLVLLFYFVAHVFLTRSQTGRTVYAMGDDPAAARLSGISQLRTLILSYGFCGFCAALAGIYLVSQQGVGTPELATKGYELASITPVVVGGVLLTGGVGSVWGTYLGVILMSTLANVLNFLDVTAFYQWIVQGVIVLLAVSLYLRKRSQA